MTYSKINFVDRQVSRPKTYTMTTNSDNTVTLTDAFGTVTTLGTPLNAENMNHIEDGIVGCADTSLSNLTTSGEAHFANPSLSNLSTTGQSVIDAKVDLSDLSKVYPVIATYVSGTSGYRIWSDGYCEQWGKTGTMSSNAVTTISLIKTYANTNYNITFISHYFGGTSDSWNENQWVYSQAVGSFGIYNSADALGGIYWHTFGYLADGQY